MGSAPHAVTAQQFDTAEAPAKARTELSPRSHAPSAHALTLPIFRPMREFVHHSGGYPIA